MRFSEIKIFERISWFLLFFFVFNIYVCLFLTTSVVAVTFDQCKTSDESCCSGVRALKFNDDETRTIESYIDLQNGESACTVVTWKDPDRDGNGETYLTSGKVTCVNGKPEFYTDTYLYKKCEDTVVNNLNTANLTNGLNGMSINYEDQNLHNVNVVCNPSNSGTGSFFNMCSDSKTIARCMADGKIVPVGKCSENRVCKMTSFIGTYNGAECVDPTCTENGVTGVFGESKCVPSNGEDINSKKVVKKCFIGGFVLTDECTNKPQCIDNGGAAICSSSATQSCHGSDVNKPELGDLAPGSSTCDSSNVMWNCGSDSKFKQGTDCSKTSAPYCYTQSVPDGSNNSTKLIAFCSNKSSDELTDDEKKTILNLTIKRGTGFWCSEDQNNLKIQTALGCVPITATGVVGVLLPMLFGIAGAISFLLMVYGFILVATSSGDEKKLMGARDTISSAITGLLVSIFAIFLFRLIAVNILKIPGL